MNDSRVSKNQTLTIVALASALVVGLPFLNKPFHIDDTFVLAIAEQICRDPLRPYSASFNWFSDPQPIFDISTNPPFLSYWLAPALAIFGPSEIAMHLAMLPFLILLALSVAALSRRFAQGSIWPVLFVMFSPAVVVSPNIMRDVPAAALVTAGIALFVAGTDQNRWFYAICGALLAGLSSTAKYSTLILIPVMALYPIFMRKPRFLLALLASFAAPGLWFLQNYMVHGKVHFLTMQSAEKANISLANMALAALVITGASFFLVPVFVVQHVVRFWRCAQALAAALILAVLLPSWIHKVNPAQQAFQYYLWATVGGVVIFWLLTGWSGLTSHNDALDTVFLLLWLVGPYVCAIVFVEFPAVRHILPAAAPIALLAMRYGLRPQETASRWVRGAIGAALGAGLAVQAVVAFWAAVGDYQYADTYRQFVREAAASLKPPSGNKIWFAGHWGWQHYASAAGFREISRTGPAPKPGDLVLVPDTVHKGAAIDPAVGQRFEQIAEKRYPARSGVVTMDWARAGFYSSGGLPPYYFGKGLTYEVFRTFRVKQ